jgi:SSS family solute:Na+ symporter
LDLILIFSVVILHFIIVLFIGFSSYRAGTSTPEDYFMGSRTFSTLTLIVSIYATNMTAFYMIGIPGMAYHKGIGVYGLVAFGTAIVTTALYYLVGYRAWLIGKAKGYMTQPEFYGKRWDSNAVSMVFFLLLTLFTVPYLAVSVMGGGLAVNLITRGTVSYGAGAFFIIAVVVAYVIAGGMRGTAWVNAYQGFLFMIVGVAAFIFLGQKFGGFSEITSRVLAEKPALLMRTGNFTPKEMFSYLLISPLAVIVFPHVFMKLLIAKQAVGMKRLSFWYPIIVFLSWPPVIFVGIWGALLYPGLAGKASDKILPLMFGQHLPALFSGLALAGILAALTSSVDAMFLAISTMFTRDVLVKYFPCSLEGKEVKTGRIFIVVLAIVVFIIALFRPSSIFTIATFAFTGYAVAAPAMIGGLMWKRANKYGAMASLVIPTLLVPVFEFTEMLKWCQFGFLYNVPILALSVSLLVTVSLLTPPPDRKATDDFFAVLDKVYNK